MQVMSSKLEGCRIWLDEEKQWYGFVAVRGTETKPRPSPIVLKLGANQTTLSFKPCRCSKRKSWKYRAARLNGLNLIEFCCNKLQYLALAKLQCLVEVLNDDKNTYINSRQLAKHVQKVVVVSATKNVSFDFDSKTCLTQFLL